MIVPPENCRVSTEDLECAGCGYKLGCLEDNECGHVIDMVEMNRQKEIRERNELARLKAKYE